MENMSGHGKASTIPPEIDRWNWGAFLLNWIWGIGNNTYIALLMFVPFVNIVIAVLLGAKGNVWAWQNRRWDSVEQFKAVQRTWTKWAIGLFAVGLVATAVMVYALAHLVGGALRSSEAYQIASARLDHDPQAIALLGTPIRKDTPSGRFEVDNDNGSANFSFDVHGPKGDGSVTVDAVKDAGQWHLNHLILTKDGQAHELAEQTVARHDCPPAGRNLRCRAGAAPGPSQA
ncbi:MAG: cytochrome c oxidase assembly factor 1 family protein [Pseudomonadota bacterium]|nr:cytochrome c oxidase assembly factor 1 family protein [Pseudomonadota bacterium]